VTRTPLVILLCCAACASARAAAVRSIATEGNTKTADSYILGRLGFGVGDEIDDASTQDAKRRLLNTRLFSDVDVRTQESPQGTDVTVSVVERWSLLPIPFASSEGGESSFGMAVLDSNLAGRGQFGLAAASVSSDGGLSWTLRWEAEGLIGPWGLEATLYDERSRRREYEDHSIAAEYDSAIAGGNALVLYRLSEGLSAGLGGGAAWHDFDTVDDYQRKPADHDVVFARGGLDLDALDWEGAVTRGGLASLYCDWAEAGWGSDESFVKVEAAAEAHLPALDGDTIVLSAGSAWANNLPDGEDLGLGGANTIRGYYPRELLGDRSLSAGIEYRRAVCARKWGTLTAVGFADTGQAWRQGDSPHHDDWYTGVGAGLRVYLARVLIPALRLEAGYGLDVDDWQVHFAIGGALGD